MNTCDTKHAWGTGTVRENLKHAWGWTASDGQTSLEAGAVDGVALDEGGGDPTSDDAELGSEDQEEPEGEDASEE